MAVQRLTVTVEMVDGTVHEDVKPILADQTKYSQIRMKHKGWPSPQDDPMLYAAVQAWAFLKRTGAYPGSWDDFQTDCASLDIKGSDEVDPTQ